MRILKLKEWIVPLVVVILLLAASCSEAGRSSSPPNIPTTVRVSACDQYCRNDARFTCGQCCGGKGYRPMGLCGGIYSNECNCTPVANQKQKQPVPPNSPRQWSRSPPSRPGVYGGNAGRTSNGGWWQGFSGSKRKTYDNRDNLI